MERNKNKSPEQIIEDINNDINFEYAGISARQCFEICQYVFYTYLPMTTDTQEVKHEKWVGEQYFTDTVKRECSGCGTSVSVDYFCSHCGAMMDLGDKND